MVQPRSAAPRISRSVTPLQMQMYMAVRIVLQTRMIRNTIGLNSPYPVRMTPKPPRRAVAAPLTPPSPPVLDSAALFNGAAEIVIRHGGRDYRLRKTRLDKLILTA